jgi:protein ImuA
MPTKQDILRQLHEDILPLQGYRPPTPGAVVDFGLGPVAAAFPNGVFPTGAVHEFLSGSNEEAAATCGFIAGLSGALMRTGGIALWIGTRRLIFPPALKRYGVDPDKLIFVDLTREKDAVWAMEEALKCEGLAAVIGEIREIDFTASRKLQLAVEKSRVTGLLLRHQPRNMGVVAAVARWRISPQPSISVDGMPGVGLPRWQVQLLKVRNGLPGSWILEWANGRFRHAGAACSPAATAPPGATPATASTGPTTSTAATASAAISSLPHTGRKTG